jgi:hypothetical protein
MTGPILIRARRRSTGAAMAPMWVSTRSEDRPRVGTAGSSISPNSCGSTRNRWVIRSRSIASSVAVGS